MEGEPVEKTYNHLAFHVNKEDLPYFDKKVRSLGLHVLPGRKRDEAEGESLYFYDYDNHLFELHTGDLSTRLKYYG
jgi:fosfomycin resistance protein FosX